MTQPRLWRAATAGWFRLLALALALWGALLVLIPRTALDGLDARVGDWAWRVSAHTTPERRIVVVDIDEVSLAALGPWPWPRERLGQLSQRLRHSGVTRQIFDILLTDPRPGDANLRAALGPDVVLAQVFALDQGQSVQSGVLAGAWPVPECSPGLPQARGHLGLAPELAAPGPQAPQVGHISPRIDLDGAVRRVPAWVCDQGHAYPSLVLAALLPDPQGARWLPGQGPLAPATELHHPLLPAPLPLDAAGDWQVPYRLAPAALTSVSARRVLDGSVPPELLRGAWVLIGSTALGAGDAVPTPFGGAQSGLTVHAQLITAALDAAVPYAPRAASQLGAGMALGAVLVLAWVSAPATRRARYATLPLALALALALALLSAFLLVRVGWVVGWSRPALAVLATGVALASVQWARAALSQDQLLAHLASYLPQPVALALLGQPITLAARAERRPVTVLVADIRNFSRYCEASSPEAAARVLHDFLRVAQPIIEAHGGLLEAVQGDAIMAIWNGSRPCAAHPHQAVAAAAALHPAIQAVLPKEGSEVTPPLALGIGVETGDALVGSIGPVQRRVHTALGEPVTLAHALQRMTAELASPVVLGPSVVKALGGVGCRPLGTFLLEGLTHAHPLHALADVVGDA